MLTASDQSGLPKPQKGLVGISVTLKTDPANPSAQKMAEKKRDREMTGAGTSAAPICAQKSPDYEKERR